MQMLKHLLAKCRSLGIYVSEGKIKGKEDGCEGNSGDGPGVDINCIENSGKAKGVQISCSGNTGVNISYVGNKEKEKGVKINCVGNTGTEIGVHISCVGNTNVSSSKADSSARISVRSKTSATSAQVPSSSNIGGTDGLFSNLEDSESEDSDYIPEDEDDVDSRSDDSLGEDELSSDDDEYRESRQNIKQAEGVIHSLDGTPNLVGLQSEREGRQEYASEYEDLAVEMNSDSTDVDADFVWKKRKSVLYDPHCDHKELKVQLGLRLSV